MLANQRPHNFTSVKVGDVIQIFVYNASLHNGRSTVIAVGRKNFKVHSKEGGFGTCSFRKEDGTAAKGLNPAAWCIPRAEAELIKAAYVSGTRIQVGSKYELFEGQGEL